MTSLPLLKAVFDLVGIDVDEATISLGRDLLLAQGLDPQHMRVAPPDALPEASIDAIIASEVLEHIPSPELDQVLALICSRLRPGGRSLVTAPNAFGCFEYESFIWDGLGLGLLLVAFRIPGLIQIAKRCFGIRESYEGGVDCTLANFPQAHRFMRPSTGMLLGSAGLRVVSIHGTVMFAGRFTSMWLDGASPFPRLNLRLGRSFPSLAGAYLIECVLPTNG